MVNRTSTVSGSVPLPSGSRAPRWHLVTKLGGRPPRKSLEVNHQLLPGWFSTIDLMSFLPKLIELCLLSMIAHPHVPHPCILLVDV